MQINFATKQIVEKNFPIILGISFYAFGGENNVKLWIMAIVDIWKIDYNSYREWAYCWPPSKHIISSTIIYYKTFTMYSRTGHFEISFQ